MMDMIQRIIGLTIGAIVALILLVGVVIWVSWTVLLPFFLGLVLAYLLLPLVNWLDRRMPAPGIGTRFLHSGCTLGCRP